MRTFFTILIIIVIALALLKIFVLLVQNKLVFIPAKTLHSRPSEETYQNLYIDTKDGETLNAWYFPADPNLPTVLFAHGNAGNLGNRAEFLTLAREKGIPILAFDYRGYGESTGAPTEDGIYTDTLSVFKYLKKEKNKDVVLWGRSIGAAACIEIIDQIDPEGIILESCFTTKEELVKSNPVLSFLTIFSSLKLQPVKETGKINCPAFVMHGDKDKIVPFEQGKKIYESIPGEKSFYRIKGAGHNNTYIVNPGVYFDKVKEFLGKTRN